MAELTQAQRRALALAEARRRRAEAEAAAAPTDATRPPAIHRSGGSGVQTSPAPASAARILQRADDAIRTMAGGASFNQADRLAGFLGGTGTEAERARSAASAGRLGGAAMPLHMTGVLGSALVLPRFAGAVPASVTGVPGGLARAGATAAEGATYGGLDALGAGTDVPTGMGIGAVGGAVSEPAAAGLSQLGSRIGSYFQGMFAPRREAASRMTRAAAEDQRLAPDAMFQPYDEAMAARHGAPIANIDRGGMMTRGLARHAANRSPEGEVALRAFLDRRFGGQAERLDATIRRVTGGGQGIYATREALQDAARRANAPRYNRAFNDPAAQSVWDQTLYELSGSPEMQEAIRRASASARSAAVQEGVPPIRSPFHMDPQTGRMAPIDTSVTPNLRFWDAVKRDLDRQGGRDAQIAARTLREHLDTLVPSYRDARGSAMRFFNAEDALDAGAQFFDSRRFPIDETQAALRSMSEPERQLFREGFADRLLHQVSRSGDNRNLMLDAIFNSPDGKQRILTAFGPERARELEAVVRIENLMQEARAVVKGGSHTARYLAEMGIAGGGSAYGAMTGDWTTGGAVIGAALARGGFRALGERAERDVAREVARLLTSTDPTAVHRGIQMVARSDAIMDALRGAGLTATREVAGAQAAGASQQEQ